MKIDSMDFKASDYIHTRHWPTWIGIGLIRLFSFLPWKGQQKLGAWLGLIAFYLLKSRRRVAQINIDLCFPELSEKERAEMLREHFKHNGIAFAEMASAWWMSDAEYKQRSTMHGKDILDKALSEGNVLLLGVHFTCLESTGRSLHSFGYQFQCMYKPAKDPLYNAMMTAKRKSYLADLVSNRDSKKFVQQMSQGLLSWYAPDQSFTRGVIYAPLFGNSTYTLTATTHIAQSAKAQVLPMFSIRSADGEGYEVHILPPLKNFPSGDEYTDACTVNKATEEMIRYAPAQYLWGHKRFKNLENLANPYNNQK